MPFEFRETAIPGLLLIEPRRFDDERGFFMETYKESEFASAGIPALLVQDNQSRSRRGVLRGLHFQGEPKAQAKLVRVVSGAVWDVAVDLRRGSPSYGRWEGVELSADNRLMFYLPPGFAHGFLALRDGTEVLYKCSAEYDKASEGGIRWNDPDLGIAWPLRDVIVSRKDADLPFLRDISGEEAT